MRRRSSKPNRSAFRFGFGGDGLLDRIRAVSFAMLGFTAAASLALVAFVASQGWPEVGSLLPGPAVQRQAVGANSIVAAPALDRGPFAAAAAAPLSRSQGGAREGVAAPDRQGGQAGGAKAPTSNVAVVAPAPNGASGTPSAEPAPVEVPVSQPAPSPEPAPASATPPAGASPVQVAPSTPTPTTPPAPSTPTTNPPPTTPSDNPEYIPADEPPAGGGVHPSPSPPSGVDVPAPVVHEGSTASGSNGDGSSRGRSSDHR